LFTYDSTVVSEYIIYMLYFLETDNETVYSTWNDFQKSFKVTFQLDHLVFLSETGKIGYAYFQTKIA